MAPKKRLKIENNHTAPCGVCFREVLAKHNLPVFEQSRGFRYVTPILLHGGIPNAFLKEFFDFLYRHEIQPHRIAIDAQTLVARWRQQADDLTTLSKPVSRFLRHGGLVAEDFVARCLDMFRAPAGSDVGEFGLPKRVQNVYREWQEQQADALSARPLRTRIPPPQRPILTVAPYTLGVGLELPPQQMPSRDAPSEMLWRITTENYTQTVDTTRQRIENGYRYDATSELLPIPPAKRVRGATVERMDNTYRNGAYQDSAGFLFFFSIHMTITKPMRWMSTNGTSREIVGCCILLRSLCLRAEQVNVYVSYPR